MLPTNFSVYLCNCKCIYYYTTINKIQCTYVYENVVPCFSLIDKLWLVRQKNFELVDCEQKCVITAAVERNEIHILCSIHFFYNSFGVRVNVTKLMFILRRPIRQARSG
jgi:hypothetical protein